LQQRLEEKMDLWKEQLRTFGQKHSRGRPCHPY
jgi:hypothetical protein